MDEPATINTDPHMIRIRKCIEENVRRAIGHGDEERADAWRKGLRQVEAEWMPPARRSPFIAM